MAANAVTFGAMTGHMGKDGSFTSGGYYHRTFSGLSVELIM
jgi:hypothetical protein